MQQNYKPSSHISSDLTLPPDSSTNFFFIYDSLLACYQRYCHRLYETYYDLKYLTSQYSKNTPSPLSIFLRIDDGDTAENPESQPPPPLEYKDPSPRNPSKTASPSKRKRIGRTRKSSHGEKSSSAVKVSTQAP